MELERDNNRYGIWVKKGLCVWDLKGYRYKGRMVERVKIGKQRQRQSKEEQRLGPEHIVSPHPRQIPKARPEVLCSEISEFCC